MFDELIHLVYLKHRGEGHPAHLALQWAKASARLRPWPDTLGPLEVRRIDRGDEEPDDSWLGHFGDRPGPGAFDRDKTGHRSGGYRYWTPAPWRTYEAYRRSLRKTLGRHEAHLLASRYARQDHEHAETLDLRLCGVELVLGHRTVGSAYCGGVDGPYEELWHDLLHEAAGEALRELERLQMAIPEALEALHATS